MKEPFILSLKNLAPDYQTAHFLLAVSGGLDSSVMTHLFYDAQISFDIAHCNFHLRGDDSNLDMYFVQHQMMESFGRVGHTEPKIHIREFDTFKEQLNSGSSIEMIARDLRYDWFRELAADYDYICTAHHANDNAETLFLNLVRGTGYKGLNAIPELNQVFIRPLLNFSSKEIKQYADKNQIPFRVDLSNHSDEFHRNKIRNRVIPILEEINPNLISTISRNIRLFNTQYGFYQQQMDQKCANLLIQRQNHFTIDIENLLKEDHAELILYELLAPFQFNFATVEQIFKHLSGESGKTFHSDQYTLIKDRSQLILFQNNESLTATPIKIDTPNDFKKVGLEYQVIEYASSISFLKDPTIAYFDFETIKFPLLLRSWQEGDDFHPFGMKGRKKLSDFFTNLKLNLFQKQQVKILSEYSNSEQILWVIGFRSDDRYKVNPKTKKILVLKITH